MQSWLDLRHVLHVRYAIPSNYQLHAAKFAGGHGNPSTDPTWNRRRHLRGDVMQLALTRIAATANIQVGTMNRATTARRHAYAHHRADVYRRLVHPLDGGSRTATNTASSSPTGTAPTRPMPRVTDRSPLHGAASLRTRNSQALPGTCGYSLPT